MTVKNTHVRLFTREPPRSVADLVKGLWSANFHGQKLSYWQLILLKSKANGCLYHGEDLPRRKWEWPKNTWFQDRLTRIYRGQCSQIRFIGKEQ